MKKVFVKMSDGSKVKLDEYVIDVLQQHPDAEIHIGCDSQNYSRTTVYVTTVVFRFPNHGAHVVYVKEKLSKISDIWNRLWAETERPIDVALYIQEKCGVEVKQIDMDYNADPIYPSNKLIKPAVGWAESLGFTTSTKPNLLMATWAANSLCH